MSNQKESISSTVQANSSKDSKVYVFTPDQLKKLGYNFHLENVSTSNLKSANTSKEGPSEHKTSQDVSATSTKTSGTKQLPNLFKTKGISILKQMRVSSETATIPTTNGSSKTKNAPVNKTTVHKKVNNKKTSQQNAVEPDNKFTVKTNAAVKTYRSKLKVNKAIHLQIRETKVNYPETTNIHMKNEVTQKVNEPMQISNATQALSNSNTKLDTRNLTKLKDSTEPNVPQTNTDKLQADLAKDCNIVESDNTVKKRAASRVNQKLQSNKWAIKQCKRKTTSEIKQTKPSAEIETESSEIKQTKIIENSDCILKLPKPHIISNVLLTEGNNHCSKSDTTTEENAASILYAMSKQNKLNTQRANKQNKKSENEITHEEISSDSCCSKAGNNRELKSTATLSVTKEKDSVVILHDQIDKEVDKSNAKIEQNKLNTPVVKKRKKKFEKTITPEEIKNASSCPKAGNNQELGITTTLSENSLVNYIGEQTDEEADKSNSKIEQIKLNTLVANKRKKKSEEIKDHESYSKTDDNQELERAALSVTTQEKESNRSKRKRKCIDYAALANCNSEDEESVPLISKTRKKNTPTKQPNRSSLENSSNNNENKETVCTKEDTLVLESSVQANENSSIVSGTTENLLIKEEQIENLTSPVKNKPAVKSSILPKKRAYNLKNGETQKMMAALFNNLNKSGTGAASNLENTQAAAKEEDASAKPSESEGIGNNIVEKKPRG